MTSLLRWTALAAVLVATCSAGAADTAGLAKRLHNAADVSSLDDPALKPWHLKLDVQMFDAKGNPSESGTIEEWWAPDADRRVYDTPSFKAVELHVGDKYYRTKGQTVPPYLLEVMRRGVVHPLASAKDIDTSHPELQTRSFGGMKLDCIMLDDLDLDVAFPPLGRFPTFCFDQEKGLLRISIRTNEVTTRNAFGQFQGHNVALDQALMSAASKAVSAHIASLETKELDRSLLVPSDDMEERSVPLPSVGRPLKSIAPIYPQALKDKHISGTVHLVATIGKDGHIASLKVTDTPDPALSASAMTAVRQWTYKPFLVNGAPAEVDTVITVNYVFSQP